MFKKFKYLFSGLLVLASTSAFVACDDDDVVGDEWSSNYVYMARPALGVDASEYTLSHTSLDVTVNADELSIPVKVALKEAASHDVKVKYEITTTGGLPVEAVSLEGVTDLVIPAGQLSVETKLVVNSDWGFVGKEAAIYVAKVQLVGVEPAYDQLRVSTKLTSLEVRITKSECMDVIANVKPDGQYLDRTGWNAWVTYDDNKPNGEWTGYFNQALNDDEFDYIFFGVPSWAYKVDMLESREITGIETYCPFNITYTYERCHVAVSEDGEEWNYITPKSGLDMPRTNMQRVKFFIPVKGRYVYLMMYGSQPAIGLFNVYSNAK